MARFPRFDLACVSQHVIQRGHHGGACFFAPADYSCYLTHLLHATQRWECAVHAYVLMENHVHLLVTPSRVGTLGNVMQAISRNYVAYFNAKYQRMGALWDGRYKSCLVDADYLLTCQRYIELNPVRAGKAGESSGYPWSSYGCNGLGIDDAIVMPHARYVALGRSTEERMRAYRQLFAADIEPRVMRDIRMYIQQQRALGSPAFQAWVTSVVGRYAGARPAHRPRRGVELVQHGDAECGVTLPAMPSTAVAPDPIVR
ncbi:transposase [Dyella monticola]|uniref:Transposase n=1 Tax=Dyella monticola TaxID=1927958 RepID=A0A370X9G2_9GAMM|nr:transposase [Dyella monticola]RDS84942.1 transposase [Dyella monticola]